MSKRQNIKDDMFKIRLLAELTSHVGAVNAIPMTQLYEAVYGETWRNKINDTRRLRKLITELRADGVAICSAMTKNGGGYYLATTKTELTDFIRRAEIRALKILKRNAQIKKISLPDYLGQIRLNFQGGESYVD